MSVLDELTRIREQEQREEILYYWRAAMEELKKLEAKNKLLREALEIIAGRRQCVDNLLSNKETAELALDMEAKP